MRREFLMLAHPYNHNKHNIAGWYASEKLDGIRCFWDGGLSRDVPTTSVPWANIINPKTGQMKAKIKQLATGLWSRYGNPIMAPDWFLNNLPSCPLDGELWAGRGGFQKVTSVCKKDNPIDSEWQDIQYGIFSCPSLVSIFQTGEIKNTQFTQTIDFDNIMRWIKNRNRDILESFMSLQGQPSFSAELANINEWLDPTSEVVYMIKQIKLSDFEDLARLQASNMKQEIIAGGGEGVFLRNPQSVWTPKRVYDCLKYKGSLDAEGTIVGFISGRETEKGSKLLGMIGALILDYNGKRLELSGLTDEERQFTTWKEVEWAKTHPGEQMPADTESRWFKVGDKVTFTYRELTNDGVPKEARYQRKRND